MDVPLTFGSCFSRHMNTVHASMLTHGEIRSQGLIQMIVMRQMIIYINTRKVLSFSQQAMMVLMLMETVFLTNAACTHLHQLKML